MADKALSFSLADFFFNDSPDVLTPPSDFQSWIEQPEHPVRNAACSGSSSLPRRARARRS